MLIEKATGEIMRSFCTGDMTGCGTFQGIAEFGSGQVRDLQISVQTEAAEIRIAAESVALTSGGAFSFEDGADGVTMTLGRTDHTLPDADGLVAGSVFGANAEAMGGVFAASADDGSYEIYSSGNFGGTR